MSAQAAVTPLGACTLGSGGIAFAPGVRAGSWVFANGVLAADPAATQAARTFRVPLRISMKSSRQSSNV